MREDAYVILGAVFVIMFAYIWFVLRGGRNDTDNEDI